MKTLRNILVLGIQGKLLITIWLVSLVSILSISVGLAIDDFDPNAYGQVTEAGKLAMEFAMLAMGLGGTLVIGIAIYYATKPSRINKFDLTGFYTYLGMAIFMAASAYALDTEMIVKYTERWPLAGNYGVYSETMKNVYLSLAALVVAYGLIASSSQTEKK